ncbi:MAG: hypothetical protein ACRC1Z_06000 [Waterburya sp.]
MLLPSLKSNNCLSEFPQKMLDKLKKQNNYFELVREAIAEKLQQSA